MKKKYVQGPPFWLWLKLAELNLTHEDFLLCLSIYLILSVWQVEDMPILVSLGMGVCTCCRSLNRKGDFPLTVK